MSLHIRFYFQYHKNSQSSTIGIIGYLQMIPKLESNLNHEELKSMRGERKGARQVREKKSSGETF